VQVIHEWPMNKWPADKRMKEIGTYCLVWYYYVVYTAVQLRSHSQSTGYLLLGKPSAHTERYSLQILCRSSLEINQVISTDSHPPQEFWS
jgi:hypothetical protein